MYSQEFIDRLLELINGQQERIANLENFRDNLITQGTVKEVDYKKGLAAIDDGNNVLSPMSPWIGNKSQGASEWNPPEVGQPVTMLNVGAQSFLMMGGFSDDAPANGNSGTLTRKDWSDGAYSLYDRASSSAEISMEHITIKAGGGTIYISGGQILILGLDIILPENDVIATAHSLMEHKHPKVTVGPSNTGNAIP